MIIVRIMGGLGNQMFQYAAARRLAYVHNTELKLDLSWFKTNPQRTYGLNNLRIIENIATEEEINAFTKPKPSFMPWRLYQLLKKCFPPCMPRIIYEKEFYFNHQVLTAPDNIYLDGYWQSERCFKDIEEIIRSEFKLKDMQAAEGVSVLKKIREIQSVSLLIRRGDYVTNPVVNKVLGVMGQDYYDAAISKLREKIKDPHIFVFSDDIEWARDNFKTDLPVVFMGQESAHADLYLMSQCRHNIVINSTFSWWGAWLNENKERIVIAPERWYADQNYIDYELILPEWEKIKDSYITHAQ